MEQQTNFLLDCIRKIDSKKFNIDYGRTSITSNRTVQNMIMTRINNLSRMGMSKIPYWYIELAGQIALDTVDTTKANLEVTKLEAEAQLWKRKYEQERTDRLKDSDNYLKLFSICKQQQKRLENLEAGKRN